MEQSITHAVIPATSYDESQLSLIKNTISKDLTDQEFSLLVEVAKRTGLDLFTRQLYGIKRGGQMTIQTGIDGYRLMAARTGNLAGIDDAIFDTESEKHPGKASVTVWRFVHRQRVPFSATARWSEYSQEKSPMWGKMPYLMLGKCAEALALRKAFPAELSGIYTHEEMDQAESESAMVVNASEPTTTATTKQADVQQRMQQIEASAWEKLENYALELGFTREQFATSRAFHKTVAKTAAALDRYVQEQKELAEAATAMAEAQDLEDVQEAEAGWTDEVSWAKLERRSLAAKLHRTKSEWDGILEKTGGSYEDTLVLVEQAEANKGRH